MGSILTIEFLVLYCCDMKKKTPKTFKVLKKSLKYTLLTGLTGGAFWALYSGIPQSVWKNLVTEPGYYNIVYTSVKVDSIEFFDHRFAYGAFYPSTRKIEINEFVTDSDDPELLQRIELANASLPLVERHEIDHAEKAKFCESLFFNNNNNYKTGISGEISAIAREIIDFSILTPAERERYLCCTDTGYQLSAISSYVICAHLELIKLPCFTEKKIYKINSDAYVERFREVAPFNQEIQDIIIKYATDQFKLRFSRYKKSIRSSQSFLGSFSKADFYNKPIGFKAAQDSTYTFIIGGHRIEMLQSISDQARNDLMFTLDSLAGKIWERSH